MKKEDDSVSLVTDRQAIPLCSICHVRTNKQKSGLYECPDCQRIYDTDREIVEYEDTLASVHDGELSEIEGTTGGAILACSEEGSATDDLYKKTRRLGVSDTENVSEGYVYYPESGTTESL